MPWPGTSFKRHNHSLSNSEAKAAGKQATAILNSGVPEGEAIAIANKHAAKLKRMHKRGAISDKQHAKLASKYGGTDQQPIDASSR